MPRLIAVRRSSPRRSFSARNTSAKARDHRNFELAEEIPDGPSTHAFCELARARGVVIVASLFEKRAAGVYHNTAAIIDADGTYLGKYRKMHIPDDPLFYEKFYFTPGDLGFRSWETRFGRIGVLVCWDQWFPEAARLTAMSGAQILFYPTAIGWHPGEKDKYGHAHHSSWETIQRSHAVANGLLRRGHQSHRARAAGGRGRHSVLGPKLHRQHLGRNHGQGGRGKRREILVQEIDLGTVDVTRTHWPFLRDRRIDAYGDLTRRLVD